MRRLVLYKDDLPEQLFEILKNIKGHGNIFYYKKKQDCLSIRDIHKAFSVIKKDLNIPECWVKDIDRNLKRSRKRAEYQRILDNIVEYLAEKCRVENCEHKLTPRIIKILLYTGDPVMQKRLFISEDENTLAGKRLETCVSCLKIESNAVFYRD